MSVETIVRHCSPTLAGLKLGNLFCYKFTCLQDFYSALSTFNKMLNGKGVYFTVLRIKRNSALIFVYRMNGLIKMLQKKDVQNFLSGYGYTDFSLDGCLATLTEHLSHQNFPHEIGVFLSYPLPDIIAFIENKGQNYKAVGCWKVYTDEDSARRTFELYKKCTRVYCETIIHNTDITRLTVAG